MASTTSVQAAAAVLRAAVDGVVALAVGECGPEQLQVGIRAMVRERDRIDGWLSSAVGQLNAMTAGRVPTADGGDRSVAGWLAEATRTSSGTAGSQLRTAAALRDLPLIVEAVLDGVLTQ